MWQLNLSRLLAREVDNALAVLSENIDFYLIAREPLSQARRGLGSGDPDRQPWSLLPVMVYEAVSGQYEPALPAAAALQLMMAAGDVFDDLEDADSSESLAARHGPAVAINAATALLVLAEKEMCRLKEAGLGDSLVLKALEVFNSFYTTACLGQHADLSLAREQAISEDDYLRTAGWKSASQIECACQIGAMLGEADEELVRTFSSFGHNLGMASQIANDIQGVIRGADVQRRKITLPLVYALNNSEAKIREQLKSAFSEQTGTVPDPLQTRNLLFQSGGMYYATVKMEFYKQQAIYFLYEAEKAGISVERLWPFLE
jgi:competence protein ComQ